MSNIQQTNQINVNEISQNINSEHYLNLMIGSQIANIVSKFNAKDGFNYKNILASAKILRKKITKIKKRDLMSLFLLISLLNSYIHKETTINHTILDASNN